MTKRDGKNGKYTRVPERDNHSDDASPSTQPPPYSPSADRPSPSFVHPHHAPMSHDSPSEPLFRPPVQHVNQLLQYQSPQAHQSQLQQHHQPGYQYNEPQHQVLRNVTTSGLMVSPLILTRPPTKVEELKSKPGLVVCQHCRHLVYTETYLENGSCTYLGILSLLLAGITSCGCCLLPLCISSFKDVAHSCPNCQEDIALYSRIKDKAYPVLGDE